MIRTQLKKDNAVARLLVAPSAVPLAFVAPGVAHANQRYLALHATRLDVRLAEEKIIFTTDN